MFQSHDLISPKYRDMQRVLHAAPRGYGGRGDKWAGVVVQIAQEYRATSILDYGCGQGSLMRTLRTLPLAGWALAEYDPAIPGKDTLPDAADLVVCTDVLEHIEKKRLGAVLAHLRALAQRVLWVVVSTKASNKILPDGRNAHLIIKPAPWWKTRFRDAGFTLRTAPTVVRAVPEKEWSVILLP